MVARLEGAFRLLGQQLFLVFGLLFQRQLVLLQSCQLLLVLFQLLSGLIQLGGGGRDGLLVSLELDEVMNLSDRILVIYEGEIVGEFDPKKTTVEELGLYMAGAKKQGEAKA